MAKKVKYTSFKKDVQQELSAREVKTLHAIGVFGNSLIVANTPVGQYTDGRVGGNLRDSNSWEVDEGDKRVDFKNNADYAPWVHEGTSRNPRKQEFMRKPIENDIARIRQLSAEIMRF